MKVLKGALNVLLSFLITLLIIANFGVNLFSNRMLSKEYMLGKIEENHYYEKIETDLKNEFENYRYQSGLPEEVFDNLYTVDMIKIDVDSMIDNLYDNTEILNNSENVRNKIVENINQYLAANNIVLTAEQEQNIDTFEDIIVSVYEDKVNLSNDMLKQVATVKNKAEDVIKLAQIGLIIALVVVILFVILINARTPDKLINTIATSLIASGILLKLVPWVIYKNIDIEHILLLTQTLSDFIKDVVYDILGKFDVYGIWFMIIGIFIIVMNCYYKIKNREDL